MGGLIADERRAANKKRILHISLGFIIGLLVGGIGVGWLAQWANGTDWRDVGGSPDKGSTMPQVPEGWGSTIRGEAVSGVSEDTANRGTHRR